MASPAARAERRPHLVPRARPVPKLTPELDKEVREARTVERLLTWQAASLHAQRMSALRAHYLADKSGGKAMPPYFALQSALMELGDAELESDALHARTESVEQALVRMQEDAFAYSAAANASSHQG